MTTIINLEAASDYRSSHYGIRYESPLVFKVSGPRVHNRHFPHRLSVWDNTVRPNLNPDRYNDSEFSGKTGPGAYVGPDGKGTDAKQYFSLGAESVGISAHKVGSPVVYGPELKIGDRVRLRYPDGTLSGEYEITFRELADPVLTACES